jgi:diadenosine tetraphosphatase ApaH/serine/threonine PP2A family protein phosphatase
MRYAVIADVHANLEALSAVVSKIAELKSDRTLCLGDIVGYNTNPNEVIDILKSEKALCIIGNHDAVACGLRNPEDFNPLAMRAALWTREQLTEKSRTFLRNLPRELKVDDFFIFHGSIHDTDRYILDKEDIKENFRLLEKLTGQPRIGFFGHTHVRTTYIYYRDVISVDLSFELSISPLRKYLINPGSVGQPRDYDPRASFLIYDTIEQKVTFYRIDYDITACQDKIIKAGLPSQLATRLETGW